MEANFIGTEYKVKVNQKYVKNIQNQKNIIKD